MGLAVWLVYAVSPVSIQGDSRWSILTALSLIHDGDADVTEFRPEPFYSAECVLAGGELVWPLKTLDECRGGRLYHFYPLAVPLVAAPLVAGIEAGLSLARPVLEPLGERAGHPWLRALCRAEVAGATPVVEVLVSSAFAAAAVAVMYLVAAEVAPPGMTLALALIMAFATWSWSVVSRALWQHSPSMLAGAVVLLILVRWEEKRWALPALGALMALAFFLRPTNGIAGVVLGLYLLVRRRSQVWQAALGALPVALGFFAVYWSMYGHILSPYYRRVTNITRLEFHPAVAEALAANLFSPARGLFVYLPFLALALSPAVWRSDVDPRLRRLAPWLACIVALQWLVVGLHEDWWGGFSYGQRHFSDVLPHLILVWLPAFVWFWQRRRWRPVLAALVLAAAFIHLRGGTSIAVHHWNSQPTSINENRARIWDWSDPPFLRR